MTKSDDLIFPVELLQRTAITLVDIAQKLEGFRERLHALEDTTQQLQDLRDVIDKQTQLNESLKTKLALAKIKPIKPATKRKAKRKRK